MAKAPQWCVSGTPNVTSQKLNTDGPYWERSINDREPPKPANRDPMHYLPQSYWILLLTANLSLISAGKKEVENFTILTLKYIVFSIYT